MKLAVITDIHANREALEAVLEHASSVGAGRFAFLGDYVGYGADPGWVVDVVREHVGAGALAVRGNHDTGAAGGETSTMASGARKGVLWSRARLSEAQIEFLRALPLTVSDGPMLFVHANAYAPDRWDYILDRISAARSMRATRCTHTFCGHVHDQHLYHLSSVGKVGDFAPADGVEIPVPAHRQWLVLPGSAGQPRDGTTAACYATVELDELVVTFHRVPYDHEHAMAKAVAAGLALSTRGAT